MNPKLWPDQRQEALLRASLGHGQEALTAFATWVGQLDIERDIDGASYRLLPLLYANLTRAGCKHALMSKLAGVYRRSWCEAQTRHRQLAAPLTLLQQADIPIMLSKGIVLGLDYYPSLGMRPMSDVDIVVPEDRADFALDLLQEAGWSISADLKELCGRRRKNLLAREPGINLEHQTAGELDLHWRLLHESLHQSADERFWENAVPISIDGRHLLRPSATDLLFHVIIHGTKPNPFPPLRWIADASMILRKERNAIDWGSMFRCAEAMRVRYRLGRGLAYLHEVMKLGLPKQVISAARVRPSWLERLEDRADRARLGGGPAFGKTAIPLLASVARFVASDRRGAFPRLATDWLKRNLRQAKAPTVQKAS